MGYQEKLRILMVEDSAPERNAFEAFARTQTDVEEVWCVPTVKEGVRIMLDKNPEYVILDWMLGDKEQGVGFLIEASKMGERKPYIFVASINSSRKTVDFVGQSGQAEQYLLKTVSGYGPDYLMQIIRQHANPMATFAGTTGRSIGDVLGRKSAESAAELHILSDHFTRETLRKRIGDILSEMGLSPASGNYRAMREVLVRTILLLDKKGDNCKIRLDREVYSCVDIRLEDSGEKMGVSGVRSGIRTAVSVIYSKADEELLRMYCPNAGSGDKGSPEPKQFILTFAEKFLAKNRKYFPVVDSEI